MLKDIKVYFENLFATKWTLTKIHFAGEEFDAKALGLKKWVNPSYSPTRNRRFGLGGAKTYFGDLYVVCWADDDFDAMELADNVSDFMEKNVDKSLFKIIGYDVVDHGWDPSDKAFIILSFNTEMIGGECGIVKKVTNIVYKGINVVYNGKQVTRS